MIHTKDMIIIGHNHYGRVLMHELAHTLARDKDKQPEHCKICGTTNNLLLNGYCIDCDDELTANVTQRR